MTDRKDGGPAFPLPEAAHPGAFPPDVAKGMALRDYFAAKAMAAMIGTSAEPWGSGCEDYVAINAYAMADAMLSEREGGA